MSEVIGKIEWIADKPNEYQGNKQLSMKINGEFYNFSGEKYTEEKLNKLAETLKKGFEVKINVDDSKKIDTLEVISDVVKKDNKQSFEDDLTTFEDLLADAHTKFKGDFSIETEMIENDWEKKHALFKARVYVLDEKSKNKVKIIELDDGVICYNKVFEAYGDATQENCGTLVLKHWIRMAETRAIARALRWATNNAKAAIEETEEGQLPDEKKQKTK